MTCWQDVSPEVLVAELGAAPLANQLRSQRVTSRNVGMQIRIPAGKSFSRGLRRAAMLLGFWPHQLLNRPRPRSDKTSWMRLLFARRSCNECGAPKSAPRVLGVTRPGLEATQACVQGFRKRWGILRCEECRILPAQTTHLQKEPQLMVGVPRKLWLAVLMCCLQARGFAPAFVDYDCAVVSSRPGTLTDWNRVYERIRDGMTLNPVNTNFSFSGGLEHLVLEAVQRSMEECALGSLHLLSLYFYFYEQTSRGCLHEVEHLIARILTSFSSLKLALTRWPIFPVMAPRWIRVFGKKIVLRIDIYLFGVGGANSRK